MPAPAIEEIRHRVAIAGVVTDAITQQVIAGAVVEVEGQKLQIKTRADGLFYFIDLPIGHYNLLVYAPALTRIYGDESTNVSNVTVQNAEDGRPILDSSANVKLSPTRLVGEVKRQDNDQPITNALIKLRGSETQTLTDNKGQYMLSGIQAGTPTVQVSIKGFVTSTQKVTLKAGKETTATFRLLTSSSR